jgi:3',5'-cyclic AMP phosphodiesterase CpdA
MADYLLIQFSDIHLTTDGSLFSDVHPRDNLVASLALLEESGLEPDVLVLSGDLADVGASDCYRDMEEIIGQAVAARGATVVYLPGNHDLRPPFRQYLLHQGPGSEPLNQVLWRDGLRIIALDSVVPGHDFGELSEETLRFLGNELKTAAPDGTVVALHHPPIPTPIEPMAGLMLREPERLAEVLDGSDVRLILSGHNHHEGSGTLGSTPVWVSPSTAYRSDVLSSKRFRPMEGAAFSMANLSDTGTTVCTVPVPLVNAR